MNYKSIYNKLITKFAHHSKESARSAYGYSEAHHVIPKCVGGTDDESNIVHLPAKAHFIAHYLLVKLYPDSQGLWGAFNLMSGQSSKQHQRDYYVSARVYELCKKNLSRLGLSEDAKKKISATLTGRKISEEHKRNMIAARIGTKRSEETKQRMREAHKRRAEHYVVSEETRSKMRAKKVGKNLTEEQRAKIGVGNKGKTVTEETKQKMREAWKRRKVHSYK
jgi:hypothetical protein